MSEFSDKFLKDLFEQKSQEFNPEDTLQTEWETIEKSIRPASFMGIRESVILIAFLLSFSSTLRDVSVKGISSYNEIENRNTELAHIEYCLKPEGLTSSKKNLEQRKHGNVEASSSEVKRSKLKGIIDTNQNHLNDSVTNIPVTEERTAYRKKNQPRVVDLASLIQKIKKPDNRVKKDEYPPKEDKQQLELYAGTYYNVNRFLANGNDAVYISSFEQSKNIFNNRLGLQISVELSGIKTFLGRVKPSLGYSVLNKSFSYSKQSFTDENAGKSERIVVSDVNHFITIGGKLLIKRNYLMGLHFHQNILRQKNQDKIVFSKSMLLFEVAKDLRINRALRSFSIRPYIQYGIPLSNGVHYNTNPINIGVLAKIH